MIKDVHTAVVDNDLVLLTARTSPPVPAVLAAAKDSNGLTPLHKAAGLNHLAVVEYLLDIYPTATQEIDGSGKTPLHWAASPEIFNKLVRAGADEQAFDYVIMIDYSNHRYRDLRAFIHYSVIVLENEIGSLLQK